MRLPGVPEDEVLYSDEADIDLNPRIGATYMGRGKQLVVLTPGKNVKRYAAGALNARTGKVVHVVRDRKNSDLLIALVEELSRDYRRARRIHLVLDNFIIHKSTRRSHSRHPLRELRLLVRMERPVPSSQGRGLRLRIRKNPWRRATCEREPVDEERKVCRSRCPRGHHRGSGRGA